MDTTTSGADRLLPLAAPLPLLTGGVAGEDAKRSLRLALAGAALPLLYASLLTFLREHHFFSIGVDYWASLIGMGVGAGVEFVAFRMALGERTVPQARATLILSALVFLLYAALVYFGAMNYFAWYGLPVPVA